MLTNEIVKSTELKLIIESCIDDIIERTLELETLDELTLRLSNNDFESIDLNAFKGFTNLVEINMANNKFKKLEEKVFDHLTNLSHLALVGLYSLLFFTSLWTWSLLSTEIFFF